MPTQRRASSFTEALEWAIAGDKVAHREVIVRLAKQPERPPTPEQMKLLAKLLQKFHRPPASRPPLAERNPATASEPDRIQMAQHSAAGAVRWRRNNERDCPPIRVMIADAMDNAARKFNVSLTRLSQPAVRNIIRNNR